MVGRTEATRAVDARLRNKFHFFAPRRRRYLAAPGDVIHAPLLSFYAGTPVREPLRPGLDLVNAVCVDLDTARSSASASRIALSSSARRVQCHRSTLGPVLLVHLHGTRSSDALGVPPPKEQQHRTKLHVAVVKRRHGVTLSLFRCCCKVCFRLLLVIETRERENPRATRSYPELDE